MEAYIYTTTPIDSSRTDILRRNAIEPDCWHLVATFRTRRGLAIHRITDTNEKDEIQDICYASHLL